MNTSTGLHLNAWFQNVIWKTFVRKGYKYNYYPTYVKAEFGKICTVSFPIVFVTVFTIPLYEEKNFMPAYQFQSY